MKVSVPERNSIDLGAPKKRSRQGQAGQIKAIVEAYSEHAEPKDFIVLAGRPLGYGRVLIVSYQAKIAQTRA